MSSTANLQGIGSILGSECEISRKTPTSLRRTLSADMSSKKWLTQQGFSVSPLKKIASSQQLQSVAELDIWSSIQSDCKKKDELEQAPAPYVHPLTKRARSLSQKSLEICTESLGSETGSDGFSSYSPSEASDGEQDQDQEEHEEVVIEKETDHKYVTFCSKVVKKKETDHKYGSFCSKKIAPRSFPPPLPFLSLHMRSHRQDGRLVLEAVPAPVPAQNNFHAQREGGRLLLTFINNNASEDEEELTQENDNNVEMDINNYEVEEGEQFEEDDNFTDKEEDEEEDGEEDEDEDEEEEEKIEEAKNGEMQRDNMLGFKAIEPKTKLPTGVINVHRSALTVNRQMGLTNRDPTSTWSPKLQNKFDTNEATPPQSLPPRIARIMPTTATAASFNTYNYCWRTKTQSHTPHLPNKVFLPKNINPQEQHQKSVLMKGNKGDYFPFSRSCMEPRRSLLMWEPTPCIAS